MHRLARYFQKEIFQTRINRKLALLLIGIFPLLAIEIPIPSKITEVDCNMLTVKTHYPSYHSSADKVLKLPQVQRWLNSVRSLGKRTTTGVETDRTEFIQHKCFWSVSLFEKEDEQLHRWRDYLVEINGQEILEFQADESLVKVQ